MVHYNECPVCGSNNFTEFLRAKDYTVSGDTFELVRCANCSLAFTQNIPEEEEIGKFYQSEDYVSHSDTAKGLVNKVYHIVRRRTLVSKRKLLQSTTGKPKANLLDVGSGTGAFLNEMKLAGWAVSGVEADSGARSIAKKLYEIDTLGNDKLFGFPLQSFDAITLWHVLEHVYDLHGYLKQFHRLMSSDGKLIVAVPNYTCTDAEIYGSYWAAYDVPRHLYHFSPQSMETLMKANGFVITKILPMWYDSFYISMLSEKYKTGYTNLLSAFISGLRSNFNAFTDKSKCSSVIYIIEKAG